MCVALVCRAQENQAITKTLEGKYDLVTYHSTSGGWYSIKKDGKQGACDLQGTEVVLPIWDDVYFGETYYKVKKNGKVGIRDLSNKELMPADKYEEIRFYQIQEYGYCEVVSNGKVGVISKELKEVIPCKYDDVKLFNLKERPFCGVVSNSKKGVYDINLQKEIIPCKYDEIWDFQLEEKNFCEVTTESLKGVYNVHLKKEIIPCKYSNISEYNGFIEVCSGHVIGKADNGLDVYCGPFGVFDTNGVSILPVIYSNCNINYQLATSDSEYIIVCKEGNMQKDYTVKEGKWGIVDKKGNNILPCKYDMLYKPTEGLVAACIEGAYGYEPYRGWVHSYTNGKWGYVDVNTGGISIPFTYDKAEPFDNGVAMVSTNGESKLISNPLTGNKIEVASSIISDIDENVPERNKSDENTFVFIISVENYPQDISSIASIHDGKIFEEYCIKVLGVPKKHITSVENATFAQIHSISNRMKDIAEVVDENARFIIYFSGLGYTSTKTTEIYLMPSDIALSNITATSYKLSNICELLSHVPSAIFIIDAPLNGTDREGNKILQDRSVTIKPSINNPKGNVILLSAASMNGYALLNKEKNHGLLTYSFLKKIKEAKGDIIIKELLDFVVKDVGSRSVDHKYIQNPRILVSDNCKFINKNLLK